MSFFADLIELLLPERCAGCGAAPVLLCDACALPLRGPARPARTTPPGLPPPWTVATYEGVLRTILAAYKEHGRTALAVPLGEALATSIQAALTLTRPSPPKVAEPRAPRRPPLTTAEGNPATPAALPPARAASALPPDLGFLRGSSGSVAAPVHNATRPGPAVRHLAGARTTRAPDQPLVPDRDVVLVWVPSGRGAVRRRGHDALRGTVNVALRRLRADGLRITAVPALRQVGHVADQAGLTAAQRTANLNGALEVTPRAALAGRQIVLVDDVITTGASLTEAARALRAAGAHVTAAATIAATPRRHPH